MSLSMRPSYGGQNAACQIAPPAIVPSATRLARSSSMAWWSWNSGTEVSQGTSGPSRRTPRLTRASDQTRQMTAGAVSVLLLACGSTVTRTILSSAGVGINHSLEHMYEYGAGMGKSRGRGAPRRIAKAQVHGIATGWAGRYRTDLDRPAALAEIREVTTDP